MKRVPEPRLEERRAAEFAEELYERARSWIPSWGLADGERDFGRALLNIAARFNSEVAERLDRAGEKMQRGFLDWLAVHGHAARPARMPVVFKLANTAREPVFADAPIRMQTDVGDATVVFETEKDVLLVPGGLQVVVAVDTDLDAFYLPPPGLSDLDEQLPVPVQWELKSFAAVNATTLQLDPETGLAPGMVVEAAEQQFRIEKVEGEIVTIDPPLASELPQGTVVRKVSAFAPYDGKTRDRQEHALYVGHNELLDLEAAATIDVVGAQSLRSGVTWQYWGKVGDGEVTGWQDLGLDPQQPNDAVRLQKLKGKIDPREIIAKKSSRWIRARTRNLPPGQAPAELDSLAIRINTAAGCDTEIPCPQDTGESPAAEGMANTTPLVLERGFLPLGREPRMFDAFYLGSTEAFSKKEAKVQLCFNMADLSFAMLSRMRGGPWWNLLAGLGADRKLHLLNLDPSVPVLQKWFNREPLAPLQPPLPGLDGAAAPGGPVVLDSKPGWRLPTWYEVWDPIVAVPAGESVWVWHERVFNPANSGWTPFGAVPVPATAPTAPIDGLVYLHDVVAPELFALRGGLLSHRSVLPSGTWVTLPTTDGTNPVQLQSIVPVLVNSSSILATSKTDGMVGVSTANKLYHVAANGACTELPVLAPVSATVQPAAANDALNRLVVVAAHATAPELIGFRQSPPVTAPKTATFLAGAKIGPAIDVKLHNNTDLHFVATVTTPNRASLVTWAPFINDDRVYESVVPPSVGQIGGAPTLLNADVVVPGARADLLVASFDLADRFTGSANLEQGIVVPQSAPSLAANDVVALVGGAPEFRTIDPGGVAHAGEVFHPIDSQFTSAASEPLVAYPVSEQLDGDELANDTLKLDSTDLNPKLNDYLFLENDLYEIVNILLSPLRVEVTPNNLPLNLPPVPYGEPLTTGGRTALYMTLNAMSGHWDARILERVPLLFPGAVPETISAKAFDEDTQHHPLLVVLDADFNTQPVNPVTFIADGTVGAWTRLLGDTSSNPELSWEYWNGKGWWALDIGLDETLNLKSSGAVRFVVPDDIESSDWSGKTNFWIRARLIGGDYGKETVTVTTNGNQQTIERSSAGIHAPEVVALHISYRLCKKALPSFVLTQDSGSTRDQSDANRTRGAIVEAFVPIAAAQGRLSGPAAVPGEPEEKCPPPCQCTGVKQTTPAAAPAATTQPVTPATKLATGRALFVGLNATPSGTPVNVLLVAEKENDHERFAPMKIEALVADRFVPIVAKDGTRALGESGLLVMDFAVPPTQRELFGIDNLTWLRLTPGGSGAANEWKPSLRGAYLNAVWASATETMTRELLGSSEGAPNLRVFLARPPVLEDTLELRVRELLGDEELNDLRKRDRNLVLSNVEGLEGDWVLWTQVTDPLDAEPTDRVYALDESNGEVRFGDGRNGMIPPIGNDSIVAFRYQRTEAGGTDQTDVPSNAVAARATLNLISPLESVEAVAAAEDAAGGAPTESQERVVRFGTSRLRHRERAVTAPDFEDLALESSPDIVQARCFTGGGVRLVVVMRGADPQPDAAEVRELRRRLLASAMPSLGARDALRISGPRVRGMRIVLELLVASLDLAGDVGRDVQQRVRSLFDTATGGPDGTGWPLGANPSDEEIALAMIDVPGLESLGQIKPLEVMTDGTERPWPNDVRPDELAMLAGDGVRLQFRKIEVIS